MSDAPLDPTELLELAVAAARSAGAFLLDSRPKELEVTTKSTPTDVVTEMDIAAERRIAATIRASRPFDVILGEEGQSREARPPDVEAGPRVRWIVDPIDGTVNYLYGLPQWAVSIAAEIDGVVEAGAVFDPSKAELFTAVRDGGAHLNGRAIVVSRCDVLSQALVCTGFGYDADRRSAQARVLLEVLPLVRDIRRLGAASLDLCALACGRLDGYYERGLNLWDYAAAGLVASEAGALVGGLGGGPASGELLVATNPGLFDELAGLLAKLGADSD